MLLTYWWNFYTDLKFTQPKVFVNISIALFFLAAAILLMASIVMSKILKALRARNLSRLKSKYDALIGEVVLNADQANAGEFTERQSFLIDACKKKYLRARWAQNSMIERMLDLKRSIEGRMELKIVGLYRALDLHQNSIGKIKSARWHMRVKGMKEASEMQIAEALYLIIGEVSSRNRHVKREAQIALIKLSLENPLYFLDKPDVYLTRWQALRIHRFIKKNASENMPSFEKWLDSRNVSVIQFALRMIGIFQQLSAAEKVSAFLTHRDLEVRKLAAATLQELSAFHLSEQLLNAMLMRTECVGPTFLRALCELSPPDVSAKIATQLLGSPSYRLKKEAVFTLLKGQKEAADIVSSVKDAEKPAIEKMINHLQDPLLA